MKNLMMRIAVTVATQLTLWLLVTLVPSLALVPSLPLTVGFSLLVHVTMHRSLTWSQFAEIVVTEVAVGLVQSALQVPDVLIAVVLEVIKTVGLALISRSGRARSSRQTKAS